METCGPSLLPTYDPSTHGKFPPFVLTAYTEHVPAALPDGPPGFSAAYQVIGKMARLSWDALGG